MYPSAYEVDRCSTNGTTETARSGQKNIEDKQFNP